MSLALSRHFILNGWVERRAKRSDVEPDRLVGRLGEVSGQAIRRFLEEFLATLRNSTDLKEAMRAMSDGC